MKLTKTLYKIIMACRSPLGGRGLKQLYFWVVRLFELSLPARGAWIETLYAFGIFIAYKSLPARGAWIETIKKFFLP